MDKNFEDIWVRHSKLEDVDATVHQAWLYQKKMTCKYERDKVTTNIHEARTIFPKVFFHACESSRIRKAPDDLNGSEFCT